MAWSARRRPCAGAGELGDGAHQLHGSRSPVTVGWNAPIGAARSERRLSAVRESPGSAKMRRCRPARRPSSRSSRPRASSWSSACPACTTSPLWEALRASPIRLVGVRHEQAAAYAADGYARATGRLGVALTTTGPGAANTLGAVGEAWASRSPVLVVATDIPTALRRPGRLPRRAARDHRPGGDVRPGRGREPRGARGGGGHLARRRPPRSTPCACAGRSTSRCRPTCWPPRLPPFDARRGLDARRATTDRRARSTPRTR